MARKTREPLAEAPPPANSSSSDDHNSADDEEEEEEEDEDETQSSSDDEKTPSPVPQKPSSLKKAPSQKKKHAPSDSDSEDSDLPPTFKVKPIASKPIDDESSKLKKPGSKPSAKRPPPETEKPPPKKTKTSDKAESTHDDGKKHLFQRVWSEEDELVILKGMIDYKANKGIDPMADSDDLFEFIKKGLHFGDANKAQFVNKVQRMKKRFENPKRRKFNNPHDLKAFELSKQVWGISDAVEDNNDSPKLNSSNAKGSKASTLKSEASKSGDVNGLALEVGKKVEGKKKKEGEVTNWVVSRCDRETPLLGGSSSIGYLTEGVLKEGVKLLAEKDKAELNQKLRKHNLEEMEVYLKRLDLIREVTEKSLNALKSAQR